MLDDYSFSSTFSILIQGFPLGPPLFNILIILATDSRIIGIQRMIAGFSIIKINLILLNEGVRFMPVTMIHMWAWHDQIKHFYPNFSLEEYSHWEHISLID